MRYTVVAALSLGLVTGCERILGTDCTDMVERAIEVEILDAATGAALAAGAVGTIVSSDHSEALLPAGGAADTLISLGAYGPAGMYDVEVTHPGYLPWRREGVRVRSGRCGVETARLKAALQQLPAQA